MFDIFFEMMRNHDFAIATDGFRSLQTLLTKHPQISCAFMIENYEIVMKQRINKLCRTRNYANKRLALSLLSEILGSRTNMKLMLKYVQDPENLEMIIGELRGKKTAVALQAWDVFKLFVANPRKPDGITLMLRQAKRMLLKFLKKFGTAKKGDSRFEREVGMVLQVLGQL